MPYYRTFDLFRFTKYFCYIVNSLVRYPYYWRTIRASLHITKEEKQYSGIREGEREERAIRGDVVK